MPFITKHKKFYRTNIKIPVGVARFAKIEAYKRDITMSDYIVRLLLQAQLAKKKETWQEAKAAKKKNT